MAKRVIGSGQAYEFSFDAPDVSLDLWYENGSFVFNRPNPVVAPYYGTPEYKGYCLRLIVWWYDSYDAVRMSIWHDGQNVTENFQLGIRGSNLKLGDVPVNVLALDGRGQTDFYFQIDRTDHEGLYWKINTMYSKYLLMGSIADRTRVVVWVHVDEFSKAVAELGLNALEVLKSNEKKITVVKKIQVLKRNEGKITIVKRMVPTLVSAGAAVIPPGPLAIPLVIATGIAMVVIIIWNSLWEANTVKKTKFVFGRCNYTTMNCGSDLLNKLLDGPTTKSGFLAYARNVLDAKFLLPISTDHAYHPIFNPEGDEDVGFGTRSTCVVSTN